MQHGLKVTSTERRIFQTEQLPSTVAPFFELLIAPFHKNHAFLINQVNNLYINVNCQHPMEALDILSTQA